jgi:hypothetical protein
MTSGEALGRICISFADRKITWLVSPPHSVGVKKTILVSIHPIRPAIHEATFGVT